VTLNVVNLYGISIAKMIMFAVLKTVIEKHIGNMEFVNLILEVVKAVNLYGIIIAKKTMIAVLKTVIKNHTGNMEFVNHNSLHGV
jgi:hypothetical protein